MIRFHNVYKTLSKKPVVNGFTTDFLRGNIYCINVTDELCHDTLCSLLTGYAKPTIGEIQTTDTICPITDSILPDDMAVIIYLEYIFEFAKRRNPDLSYDSIQTVVTLLELSDILYKRIRSLSEFQKDRVKIASGILSDCDTLVITKPVVTLSRRIRRNFFKFLQIYKSEKLIIFLTRQGGGDYEYDELINVKNGRITGYISNI
ncbi:MAG: hypothetical protein R3Y32_05525 [Bacillota bacterium]